jgi:hypothetical protein
MKRFYFTAVPTYVCPVAGDDDPTDDDPPEDKTLNITQKQLDDMIESRLKRDRASRKGDDRKEIQRLKELQSSLQLQEEEKRKLEEYVDELEKKTLSADEIRAKEAKKAKEQWEADLKAANERAIQAESKYITSRINTDLSIGAQQHGVLPNSTGVVMAFLKPLTEVEAVIDEETGQPTGEERVIINFPDVDEEGKAKQRRLPVQDAYKRMRELTDQYGNLFDKNKSGGIGGASGTSTAKTDGYRPGMNMDDYMKNRETIIKG